MQNLFVYGTLMIGEILQKVTGKNFEYVNVTLENFSRRALKECEYPAIIPSEFSSVKGKLILNVDDESMKLLVDFEGAEYEKTEVEIQWGNLKMKAVTFVWAGNLNKLMESDWDENHFREKHQLRFLEELLPGKN